MAGPDVGGSMGGQDPEKYGPIRSLLKYYSTKPHIFRSCVKDNRKRFGPRVNNVCAWVKDQIKGTTYWRGKEAELRGMMLEEGMTEADIQIIIYDTEWGEEIEYPPSREMAEQMCENCGVDYDPDGYDEACPGCGEWADCDCDEMHEAVANHVMQRQMKTVMQEAKGQPSGSVWPSSMSKKDIEKAEADLKARRDEADKAAGSESSGSSGSGKSKKDKKTKKADRDSPREVARPENGTIVYDDGSIRDKRTGVVKYPVQAYQDGSVRYDDGSVAKPGSLAALLIMQPMTKEDRNRLFAAGPAGLPLKDFASVDELIDSVVKQAYANTGKGGAGELANDEVGQQQSMGDFVSNASAAKIVGAAAAQNMNPSNVSSPGNSADDRNAPMKPRRGEDIVRGPNGGRGVWRNVDGRSIFIKIGQTPAQARQEAEDRNKKNSGGQQR